MNKECPILIATKMGEKISSNPCNDCAFFGNCLEDLERDMGEEILKITGAYIRAAKEATREYMNRLIVAGRNP